MIVHVAGAVRRPGVYRMRPSARVDDAVGRAGGATGRADLSQVNLAAKVEDGRQVLVPEKVRAAPGGSPGTATAPATQPGVPLNLNTATLEQLDELDGIGPATAQSILDYREDERRLRLGRGARRSPRDRRSPARLAARAGAGVRCAPPPRRQRSPPTRATSSCSPPPPGSCSPRSARPSRWPLQRSRPPPSSPRASWLARPRRTSRSRPSAPSIARRGRRVSAVATGRRVAPDRRRRGGGGADRRARRGSPGRGARRRPALSACTGARSPRARCCSSPSVSGRSGRRWRVRGWSTGRRAERSRFSVYARTPTPARGREWGRSLRSRARWRRSVPSTPTSAAAARTPRSKSTGYG